MEGIAAAKARDVHFGPEAQAPPEDFAAFHQAWRTKQMTLHEAADACGMPKSTFYNTALRAEAAVGRISKSVRGSVQPRTEKYFYSGYYFWQNAADM